MGLQEEIDALKAEIVKLKECTTVDKSELPDLSDKSFRYEKYAERLAKITSSLTDAALKSLEPLFLKERLKGHEIGTVTAQVVSTAMQSAPSILQEAMKLDSELNPFFQYDAALKTKELAMANAKIKESCSKADLVAAQAQGYRVQTRSDIVKLQVNGWSTHHSQAKTVSIPTAFENRNITESINELFEMVDEHNPNSDINKFKYDPVAYETNADGTPNTDKPINKDNEATDN